MRYLVLSVLLLSALLSSSTAHSKGRYLETPFPARYKNCEPYRSEINKAVEKHWSKYPYAVLWAAQLYQESLCKLHAVSHVGAKGIAQFMPATWRDISLKLDIAGTPFDRHSIDAGAFYMAKLSARWTSERPEFERHRLAQASYNSGFGNVVKSQRLCNGAPYWDEIKVCQPQVTGRHAAETIGYVTKIEEHARNMAKGLPWLMPKGLRDEFTAREIARIAKRYDIRRYFNGLAWGTYWRLWGGWITADHVHKEMHGTRPPFIDKNAVLSRDEGVIDATGYGLEFPDTPPRAPKTGETIYILGYPAGSLTPTLRLARIHAVRSRSAGFNYTHPDTVSSIDAPTVDIDDIRFEPVTGGMSGGLAVTLDGKTPLGVLVTQNSPAELSGDDKPDHSADIVPLRDFWEAMK